MKKYIVIVVTMMMLGFAGCGGSSSAEAKELLQKILQFIGLPHSMAVQVCQDSNTNGICNINESKTTVTINKGDTVEDILEKISLTDDGKYFLETYNPELPILVELQDVVNVHYDDGKFTLAFNGFKTKEDDNETKEISILESMVDANALSKEIADTFRTLNNEEAQEKYYVALLSTLESNLNILRVAGLESQAAVKAAIIEMGDESRLNQAQAENINNCGNDQTCVDREIKTLSDELIITDAEVLEIKAKDNPSVPEATSPSTAVSTTGDEEVVFGKWVRVSRSVCESNGGIYSGESECIADWENAKNICLANGDELPTIETLRSVVSDCGGTIDDTESNVENESYHACYKDKGFNSDAYWSSTTYPNSSDYARLVSFNNGYQGIFNKNGSNYVRCVRAGQ